MAEATQEELEKIDMEPIEFESEAEADASTPRQIPEALMRTIAAVGALAAAVVLVAITPVGSWLVEEVAIVGATVAKVSALFAALVERIPWPQPVHGEQGLWETITILFTSVIVRCSPPVAAAAGGDARTHAPLRRHRGCGAPVWVSTGLSQAVQAGV